MDMGDLFDSISGEGFSNKRQRSMAGTTNGRSDRRVAARFRRIPALNIQDEN